MMLTRTRTRPVTKIATRSDPTRWYTRTRSLPVGLPLLSIIGLVAKNLRIGNFRSNRISNRIRG